MKQRYVENLDDFKSFSLKLPQEPCPHCRQQGYLIRNGTLKGYGKDAIERIIRGWRIYCSNRNRRKGCGRTFPVMLSDFLPRRQVTATILNLFLSNLLRGLSVALAWPPCSHGVECAYKLRRLLTRNPFQLRTLLFSKARAPDHPDPSPLMQTLAHLFSCFKSVAAFHLHFQTPLI